MIAVPSDGGDALSKANLVRALQVFQEVSAISITYEVRTKYLDADGRWMSTMCCVRWSSFGPTLMFICCSVL